MIDEIIDQRVQQFWGGFVAATQACPKEFAVLRFGDGADLADELATHVLTGNKRAMTSLLREFVELGRPIPKPGNHSVVVDGTNTPRCIIRTVRVDIRRLHDVDESFAWEAGGGDRSLEWWRTAHARYFKRRGSRGGFAVDDDTEVILERFEVVWPVELCGTQS
jgi:uncharacterized protein YhfF